MVRIIFIFVWLFVHSVVSTCPIWTPKSFNRYFDFYGDVLQYKRYRLYQYKPVDLELKSPFYVISGKSNRIELWGRSIQQVCSFNNIQETEIRYNKVNLLD